MADSISTSSDPAGRRPHEPSREGQALAGICLGFFVVLFDATAVNVATGSIADSLGGSVVAVQWVLNAYTVAFAALVLTAGSLSDRWGARRTYLAGSVLFGASSAACALAPSTAVLIVARVLQGFGAAAIVPCSLALIAHRFPEGAARARAFGVWGGVSGVGLAAGPVLGGALVDAFGWRSVFLVVIPVVAVSVVLIARRVTETPCAAARRLDVAGQFLAVITLVALTASLTQVSTLGWSDARILGLFGLAAIAGIGFVLVENRVADPMLPPQLFASRRFSGATAVGLLFNLTLYGVLFCLALVLDRSLRQPATVTGLTLLPLTVVVAVGAWLSGPLSARLGPQASMLLGLTGGLVGAGLLAGFGDRVGVIGLAGFGAVLGLVGFAMPAMTSVALTAAGPERAGLGAAALNAARQAGGALGVALLGSAALLDSSLGPGSDGPHLLAPMIVAVIGYLVALTITATAIRPVGQC